MIVKFGFFEVQLGFKSCTGYFYKGQRKENINKNSQKCIENNLINIQNQRNKGLMKYICDI
jgi:hypothetical protein